MFENHNLKSNIYLLGDEMEIYLYNVLFRWGHIVVLFGIIIFFGGLDITRSLSTLFDSFWADLSKLMLLTTGFVFSYWNIKSFIFVRKKRNLEN